MDRLSPYYRAHVTVASVRLLDHRNGVPPSVKEVAEAVSYSLEEIQSICNLLEEMGVLRVVKGGVEERLFVQDPVPLESLSREKQKTQMEEEIKQFEAKRKADLERAGTIHHQETRRKKHSFLPR